MASKHATTVTALYAQPGLRSGSDGSRLGCFDTGSSGRSWGAGAGGAGGLSRFRPKNVRRDADERKKLEEQRSRDLAAKIKVEERELAKEERRARRGGRGRGDAMSQRGTMRRGGASGPFSAMPQENMKGGSGTAYGWSSGGGGRGGSSSGKGGFGGGRSGPGGGVSRGELTDEQRYRPRREHEARVNVEVLSGFAEDDEGKLIYYEPRSNGAHPVGLFRTEHEDEIVKVATTAELEAEEQESDDDGDLFVPGTVPDGLGGSGGGMADNDNEIWHAAPTGASGSAVKPEPGTETESMDIDMADIPDATTAAQIKAPPSPELTKKTPAAVSGATVIDPSKEKKREKALQDPEVQHQMYDMQTLIQELSYYDPNIGTSAGAEGGEGGEEAEASKMASRSNGQDKEGRLYLFQLPPVLPPLVRPDADGSISSAPIDLDQTTAAGMPSQQTSSSPLTTGMRIKSEDSDPNNSNDNEPPTSEQLFPPEGGYIGKLVVRKSGKVSLDWGGTRLDLGMATETDFLTSSVMLETKDHPDQADMVTGHAAGMGQIMGKFVLTPVWDEEEDWNPSLEGIDMGDGGGGGGGGG
ncbi:DNA-directed RNA polymerase III subunit RPC4 [Microdochium nivale]|nr:DNA-directed RNA polymerase III subunit RPC4 [Microdochium nivale]